MKKIKARTQSRNRNDTGTQGGHGVGHDRQCTGADMTSIYEMKYIKKVYIYFFLEFSFRWVPFFLLNAEHTV